MQKPQAIELSQEEAEALNQCIKNRDLLEPDWKLFEGLAQFIIWLQFSLKEAKISIGCLSSLFGFSKKKTKRSSRQGKNNDASPEQDGEKGLDSSQEETSPKEEKKNLTKRLG